MLSRASCGSTSLPAESPRRSTSIAVQGASTTRAVRSLAAERRLALRLSDRAAHWIQHPANNPVRHLAHHVTLPFGKLGELVERPGSFLFSHLCTESVQLRETWRRPVTAKYLLQPAEFLLQH